MNQPRNVRREAKPRRPLFNSFVVVAVLLMVGACLVVYLPSGPQARSGVGQPPPANRLKRIEIALWSYHSVQGSLPPAYLVDGQGRRTHSWRALILPYLNEEDFAATYRFDEPWDGPHNRQLAKRIPAAFRSPKDDGVAPGDTSSVAIVGSETMWPGTALLDVSEVTDGMSQTIMLTEMVRSSINWMEPRDLDFAEMTFRINADAANSIRGHEESGAYVASGDGFVHWLSVDTPEEIVRALCTKAGSESIPDEW